MATYTPWGYADGKTKYAVGVNFYTTPSHGGIILSEGKNKLIPDYARRDDRAYEEDCDYAIVVTFLGQFFSEEMRTSAKASLRVWNPDIYERYYGEVIPSGESWVKDKRVFKSVTRESFVVTSASGDWHADVPEGYVGVTAVKASTDERREFLVNARHYAERGQFGYVINEAFDHPWFKTVK